MVTVVMATDWSMEELMNATTATKSGKMDPQNVKARILMIDIMKE